MKKFLLSTVCALFLLGGYANAKEFSLDKSHSNVSFKIKHLKISKVKGEFDNFDAKIDFDVANNKLNTLEATVDVKSVNTKNDKRDTHLKAPDFFDAAKFETMKFTMTEFIKKDEDDGIVKGNLTIRDVTKPVEFEFDFGGSTKTKEGKTKIGFNLEGKINRLDFGVGSDTVTLGDKVEIDIEVEALEN